MKKPNLHGDIGLIPVSTMKPPKKAKQAKLHILQESNATGNRHEVSTKKGFIFYWKSKDKEFIHCDNDYEIRHVGGDCEHGVQPVEAGTREIRHEEEYDPWQKELKRVID